MNTVLSALVLVLSLSVANAADERARRDVNQMPAEIAVTTTTPSEIRQVRTTPEGYLITVSTWPQAVPPASAQGTAAATAGAWPVKITDGTDTASVTSGGAVSVETTESAINTPLVSTGTCGVSASLAFGASPNKSTLFCNEGEDAVRVGGSGVTSDIGTRVLGDTCISLDGEVSAFQAALYCIRTTGSDQAYSTYRGQ